MRAVRCDACGAKAMIAAAKCPSCGHLFELRDGFGEQLPLSYCSDCESYYPETVGSCKWCGTKPARKPIDPRIWRGAGAGIAAVVGAVWLIQNGASQEKPRAKTKTVAAPASTPAPTSAPLDSDVAMAKWVATTTDSLSGMVAVAGSAGRDSVVHADTAPPATQKTEVVPPPVVVEPVALAPRTDAPAKAVTVASKAKRPSSRWVRSVSRHWVVVRAGASKESRIVASIGPNSRVELGESRGDWQRIRTKGIAGWVSPRSSFELASVR